MKREEGRGKNGLDGFVIWCLGTGLGGGGGRRGGQECREK